MYWNIKRRNLFNSKFKFPIKVTPETCHVNQIKVTPETCHVNPIKVTPKTCHVNPIRLLQKLVM